MFMQFSIMSISLVGYDQNWRWYESNWIVARDKEINLYFWGRKPLIPQLLKVILNKTIISCILSEGWITLTASPRLVGINLAVQVHTPAGMGAGGWGGRGGYESFPFKFISYREFITEDLCKLRLKKLYFILALVNLVTGICSLK